MMEAFGTRHKTEADWAAAAEEDLEFTKAGMEKDPKEYGNMTLDQILEIQHDCRKKLRTYHERKMDRLARLLENPELMVKNPRWIKIREGLMDEEASEDAIDEATTRLFLSSEKDIADVVEKSLVAELEKSACQRVADLNERNEQSPASSEDEEIDLTQESDASASASDEEVIPIDRLTPEELGQYDPSALFKHYKIKPLQKHLEDLCGSDRLVVLGRRGHWKPEKAPSQKACKALLQCIRSNAKAIADEFRGLTAEATDEQLDADISRIMSGDALRRKALEE